MQMEGEDVQFLPVQIIVIICKLARKFHAMNRVVSFPIIQMSVLVHALIIDVETETGHWCRSEIFIYY
jgi:hypothetical protein